MPGPEQPFDINTAIDGLSRPQLEGFIANAKAYLAQPDHQEFVVNFENGEQQQAREQFQRALANLKDLSQQHHLVKPTLTDLAPAIFEGTGKSWEALTPERQSAYLDFVRRNAAGRIEKGRVYPADPMVKELFDLLHEGEAEAIKAMIGEQLARVEDEPWALAWRGYLQTVQAVKHPVGDSVLTNLPPDYREGIVARREQRARANARATIEQVLRFSGGTLDQVREQLGNPNLSLRQYAEWNLQPTIDPRREILQVDIDQFLEQNSLGPRIMANNVFIGKVLPGDELIRKINEKLTNEGDREALRNQIAAKIKELAGRREFPSQEEQAWREAWERALVLRGSPSSEPAANQNIPPEIAGDKELSQVYREAVRDGDLQRADRLFEAVRKWAAVQNPSIPFNRKAFELFYEAHKE